MDEEKEINTAEQPTEEEQTEAASPEEEAPQEEDVTAKLQKELDEQKDKYLRLMAEYDNYRKRTAKQQLEIRDNAVGDTVLGILAVYDNFARAVETESTDEKYKSGVEMIFKQFTAWLEKMNITLWDPTGEPFDPSTANAVSTIEDAELGENVVAQVYEEGVKLGERVLRYPTVVVANP